jgi:hypothetical protein
MIKNHNEKGRVLHMQGGDLESPYNFENGGMFEQTIETASCLEVSEMIPEDDGDEEGFLTFEEQYE